MAIATMSCSARTARNICDFPSAELIVYRRRLVDAADRTVDPRRTREIMESVLKIDQLRILHEAIDGCGCWYEAAK